MSIESSALGTSSFVMDPKNANVQRKPRLRLNMTELSLDRPQQSNTDNGIRPLASSNLEQKRGKDLLVMLA